jgi:hypothetical protein
MAQIKTLSKTITNSDQFLDMPKSAQTLYFHLAVNADKNGNSVQVKSFMRIIGSADDDLKILVEKGFVNL